MVALQLLLPARELVRRPGSRRVGLLALLRRGHSRRLGRSYKHGGIYVLQHCIVAPWCWW